MCESSKMRFPVLMYHSLSDGRFGDKHADKYSVSEKTFAEHINYLTAQGYTVDSCAGLAGRLAANQELPANYCVLTVDDGHISGTHMAKMLNEKQFKASFFVTADYCSRRLDFMGSQDLRELHEAGMDIGGHGLSHRSLRHMSASDMRGEIEKSTAWIEAEIGVKPVAMSLPAGQGGQRVTEAVFSEGYKFLADSEDRLAAVAGLPSLLHRFVVMDGYGCKELARLLAGSPTYILKRRIRQILLSGPKRLLRTFDMRRPE